MTAKPVEIIDLSLSKYKTRYRNSNPNMPQHPFRMMLVGQSNCGKTNCIVNLILKNFSFDKIYVIAPNVTTQPVYRLLKDQLDVVDDKVQKELLKKIAEYNRTHRKTKIDPDAVELDPIAEYFEELPSDLLERLDESKQNLIILDDLVICDKRTQSVIDKLSVRGRHKNASVVQLVQSFYRASRISRLQCNAFILFHSVSEAELSKYHREMGCNVPRKKFIETIMEATRPKWSFVVVDLDHGVPYRRQNFVEPLFA